jgi:hypothetical protein
MLGPVTIWLEFIIISEDWIKSFLVVRFKLSKVIVVGNNGAYFWGNIDIMLVMLMFWVMITEVLSIYI